MHEAQGKAVPHNDVCGLHAPQDPHTLMSQHVRIKALVGEVTRKACSAKRDPRNHHTLRLRPTMATRIPVSRRRVVIEITVEVLKLPLAARAL